MPVPQTASAHGDLFDRRFSKIFDETYSQLPEMRTKLFNVQTARKGPDEKFSQMGELGDYSQFTGNLEYDATNQGYDVTATHIEWAKGMRLERKLMDDDLFMVMDRQPAKLARAAMRTKETHGSRPFTMAFSVDNLFYSHSEGVALCSNAHTTTAPGVSTATGFDNLGTAALSAVAVEAARIQMRGFRGDRGERINVMPDEIWIHPNLYATAYEIVSSMGKVDSAENNRNVHEGQYTIYEWNYMSDANDWFMCDSAMRNENLLWFERIPVEFDRASDFETFERKYRSYMRYSYLWVDWRFILGHQVS